MRCRWNRPGTGVGKSGLATLLLCGGVGEQPRLGLLERVDVTGVVAQDSTRDLHVSHACQLQLEVDPVGLALGLELRDLVAQLFGRLCVPGGLCHLGFQRRDLLVTLRDGLLPIGAAHLRLVLRRLLLPEVFLGLRLLLRLVAMVITGHVSHLSCRGRQRIRPLNLYVG